jgi:hypothetical protein
MNSKIEKCRQCRFWLSAEDAYNMYGDSDLCLVDPEPHVRHGDFPICSYMEGEQSDEGIDSVLPIPAMEV